MKEKYLKYIFCIFSFTRKISSMFVKESSKLIKENTWTIIVEHICVPLLLSVFSRKMTYIYIYEVKVNSFWSHYIFDLLDQAS